MRQIRFALILAVLAAAPVAAQTRMLRSPTVSEKNIAFAYANNIWIVDRAGGAARRLTSFQGETTNPKLSPDGKWLAFSAEYGGNTDVYVVATDPAVAAQTGGQPKRLAWHPGADVVPGRTPDGKRIAYRMNDAWDEERRNYRGGQNRPIWIVDPSTFELESPPWKDSKEM